MTSRTKQRLLLFLDALQCLKPLVASTQSSAAAAAAAAAGASWTAVIALPTKVAIVKPLQGLGWPRFP
jgi:hypothetical protein